MDSARRLVPTAIRRRYAVKFGIALLLLGLSVGLIGLVATAGITDEVEDRVEDDHGSFASQEAQSLQLWQEQNEREINSIARSDVVADGDPAAIQEWFLDRQEHLDADAFAIAYVDSSNGDVLATTNESLRDGSVAQMPGVTEESFQAAGETVPWLSEPYVARGDLGEETAVVDYVVTVPGQEDRAIVYTADVEAYSSQLADDPHVTTLVLGGDDRVLLDNAGYAGGHDESLGLGYGSPSYVEDARTEGTTTRQISGSSLQSLEPYDFPDEEHVVSASRVKGTDWVVVTHEPTDQAYGFVSTVDDWGTIATLLGVLLIGLVGAVLGRNTAVSIDRLTEKAGRMEEGDLDVDLETKRVDNVGRLYAGFDSMRVALREQIEEAEAAREEAERERERVQEINDHLERRADEYSEVMTAAAAGDLTARMETDDENEAMAEIADEFNAMLEELERTVAELNGFATDVATASEEVTSSSEEVRSASRQVAGSVQEISEGAERQNEALQSVDGEMSALSTTTEEIAASSNEVADIAERTVDTGREGREAAQDAIGAMDEIETEAETAVAEIRDLEREVQQIDELIATISDIAQQTNMLALNANIEASRSAGGDDEGGFSVVAQEVKQLSEDVADAADEIEDRLEAIRDQTGRSAAEVEGTSERIDQAGNQVEAAVDALEEIAELARETNGGVQEISAATQQQAASTQEVVAIVDDAATISEETTAEAETVAAAAEEQTTALSEVTGSASALSQRASRLSEGLDRFETGAGPADGAGLTDRELTFEEAAGDDEPVSFESADESRQEWDVDEVFGFTDEDDE